VKYLKYQEVVIMKKTQENLPRPLKEGKV